MSLKQKLSFFSGIPFYFRVPLAIFFVGMVISAILGYLLHHSYNKSWETNGIQKTLSSLRYIDRLSGDIKDQKTMVDFIVPLGMEFASSPSPSGTILFWNPEHQIIYHNSEAVQKMIEKTGMEFIKDFELIAEKYLYYNKLLSGKASHYSENKSGAIHIAYRFRNGYLIALENAIQYDAGIKYKIGIYLSLSLLTVMFTLIAYILTFGIQHEVDEILILRENTPMTSPIATPETVMESRIPLMTAPENMEYKENLNHLLFQYPFHKMKNYEISSFPRNPAPDENAFLSSIEINNKLFFLAGSSRVQSINDAFHKVRLQERFRTLAVHNPSLENLISRMEKETSSPETREGINSSMLEIENRKLRLIAKDIFSLFLWEGNGKFTSLSGEGQIQSYSLPQKSFIILLSSQILPQYGWSREQFIKEIQIPEEKADNAKGALSFLLSVFQQKNQGKPAGIVTVIEVK